jgi:hypothetical protein
MRRLSVLAFALAIVALAGFALAAEKAAEKKENPAGKWTWKMPGRGGGPEREFTLTLKLDGEKLTGAVTMPGRGGGDPVETKIEDGKYKDGEVSFAVTREFNGNKMTTKYKGKLSGDTIKGKLEMPARDGGDPMTRDWEANRAKTEKAEKKT